MNRNVCSDGEHRNVSKPNVDENRSELKAVNIQINEIEKKIHSLRTERNLLLQRQKELKEKISKPEENRKLLKKQENRKTSNENWSRTDFPWSSKVEEIRSKIFHLKNFRNFQLETINVTLSNRDCILIMPTGGGKSLCYQLPSLISEGISIVVSPLLALVEDQMYGLNKLKIDARTLNGSTSREEQNKIFQFLDGKQHDEKCDFKILYLTPEKIAKSKSLMSKLQKLYEAKKISRLVVDEVHCVSQFGHDFRPDYKFLSIFRRQFPELPILGLTATATLKVIEDIKKILKIDDCVLFRAPFNRKNLFYEVLNKSDVGKDALSDLLNCIQSRFDQQSGIVYCLSQKDTEDVCFYLQQNGIRAGCYHAALSSEDRTEVHEKWLRNELLVICATIAFGMGIDKGDVRFVIHHSMSKSLENFYQESGRAGRDDENSTCILFFRFGDVFRLAPMAFKDKSGNGLKNLYSMISYCINENECRRKLISAYFDDCFQSDDCNKMCDICSRPSDRVSKRDCRDEALSIIEHLENHSTQRLTPLKILDQISIKTMNKVDVQRLFLKMLMEQYLKENFRFTSFSTICYIALGPRANYFKTSNLQISIDIAENTKKRTVRQKKTINEVERNEILVETQKPRAKPKRRRIISETDEENDENVLKKKPNSFSSTD